MSQAPANFMTWRGRLFQLGLMTYGNFETGLLLNVLGPTLPDLQCVFHADLDDVSNLFLSLGLAATGACVLSVFLIKKCNIYLLLGTMMLIYCAGTASITLTPYMAVACVALLLAGFSIGVLYNGCLYMCSKLFPGSAYAFHVLGAGLSAGSFFIPIFAKPFLGRSNEASPGFRPHISRMNNSTDQDSEGRLISNLMELGVHLPNTSHNSSVNSLTYCENVSSKVHYLYITLGLLGLPLSVAFFVYFLIKDPDVMRVLSPNEVYTQLNTKASKCAFVFIMILTIPFFSVFGLPYTYGSYLTTVSIKYPFHMDVQSAAVLVSLFWLLFFLGRVVSTAVSACMRQLVILYVCFIGEILSASLLVVTQGSGECFLWIASLSMAFFSGPAFPGLLAWGREYISLTPCILGIFLLTDNIGVTFLPYIAGQLISYYGEKMLGFFCLTVTVLQLMFFCSIHGLGTVLNRNSGMIEMGELKDNSNTIKSDGNEHIKANEVVKHRR